MNVEYLLAIDDIDDAIYLTNDDQTIDNYFHYVRPVLMRKSSEREMLHKYGDLDSKDTSYDCY